MTEKSFPGPMSMIKIDGKKIKELREQQGLTQLYLATAVDVTTDTISRWENKRYPSIKKENGIRLAEALEVDLEEIIDQVSEVESSDKENETGPAAPFLPEEGDKKQSIRNTWLLLLLAGALLASILGFTYYFVQQGEEPPLTATRISPSHFIAGQPFPVIIELTGKSVKEVALILKESIPPQAQIIQTIPAHSGKSSETPSLKWITKASIPTSFSYLIKIDSPDNSSITFKGTIGTTGGEEVPILGNSTLFSGQYHWADSDRNNIISDKEILTVYDKYAEIGGLEDEIDLIEEIWLGEGYSWNTGTLTYDINE